jgi:predicted RNA-binding protein YlqC (UPF0109 family)
MIVEQSSSVFRTKHLVTKIARSLVDDESVVRVEAKPIDTGTVFRIHVALADAGKLIGKHGRHAHALRHIIATIGSVQGVYYSLDIVQPTRNSSP